MPHAGVSWGRGDWVTTDYIYASNAHLSSLLYRDCPVVTLPRPFYNAQTRRQMLLDCKIRLRIIAASSSNKIRILTKYGNESRWQHHILQQDGFAVGPGLDLVCRPSVQAIKIGFVAWNSIWLAKWTWTCSWNQTSSNNRKYLLWV